MGEHGWLRECYPRRGRDRLDSPASIFEEVARNWGQLLDAAARIAGGMQAIGVKPGDRVAILSANSADFMTLYLAIPWAGAVLVPLNCRWSPAENAAAIEDCTPGAILVADELIEPNAAMLRQYRGQIAQIAIGEAPEGWTSLDALMRSDPVEDAGRAGDDLLAIFYTGGTTGRPKGVMLSHASLTWNCQTMRATGLFPDGCRSLVVAPLFHLAAAAELTMIMLAGGTAVIEKAFHPTATLHAIGRAGVTDALLVPTMIQMLLDGPWFDPARLLTLRRIMYGASPMPEATLERIMAAAPHVDFTQAYGMTEVSCTATLLPPDHHRGDHRAAGHHRAAGRPMTGTEVIVADADGTPLPPGSVGEVLVRGPGVMLGYWNLPDQTAEALRDGWMHTGDGGRFDEHGLLYIVDRMKDMIVSGGENVFSAEVESALAEHGQVGQVAVIGVPDPRWGERVHAIVVPRSMDERPAQEELIEHCRARIAGYKCPRSIEFREQLPLSAAGKILKSELRKAYWEGESRNVA